MAPDPTWSGPLLILDVQNAAMQNGKVSPQALINAINNACGKVPFAGEICSAILIPKVQQIVDDLNNKLDGKAVCKKIKLCK